MKKHLLLAGATALAATFSSGAWAQDGNNTSNVEIDYRNNIDTSVVTDVTYTKDVALRGNVRIDGEIEIDSSAVAVNDSKQISGGNTVLFREENELDGENGFVDPLFGPGVSEAGQDPNDLQTDGVVQDRIRVGFFAPIINTVASFDVGGSGNVGVNIAAGYYNMQENAAVLAVSTSDSPNEDDGGWSEASTTSLQASIFNTYAGADDPLDEDDEEAGGGGNNFRDRNTVVAGAIGGAGNIGVNAAAGAFNMQQNLMTLAVATDSSLAEANAAVVQAAALNFSELQDSQNVVDAGAIGIGATGNIGVNLAAGVGNMQHNSLTAAVSSGGGDGTGGGGDPDAS